jgi:hypothetical protein
MCIDAKYIGECAQGDLLFQGTKSLAKACFRLISRLPNCGGQPPSPEASADCPTGGSPLAPIDLTQVMHYQKLHEI